MLEWNVFEKCSPVLRREHNLLDTCVCFAVRSSNVLQTKRLWCIFVESLSACTDQHDPHPLYSRALWTTFSPNSSHLNARVCVCLSVCLAQNQDLWPREPRRPNLTGTHTSIWSRSFLRQLADLVHMPGNSLTICCDMLTTHQLRSETLGPPSKVFFTVPFPNNNSRQPLRDSWGLLSHPVVLNIWYLWLPEPIHRERTQPFQSRGRCSRAMWPCCDITSSDDDEHNIGSNFLLLFAGVGITPILLEGLTEVDVLHIALGCRFALDIFTISKQYSPTPDHEPLPHDPELFLF